mgnify:CR=1 FL=1
MRWTLLTTTAAGALTVLSGMASAQDTGALGSAQQALDNEYQIQGQEVDPNVPVQDRPRPDYDPLGIRRGSFFFFPSIDASVGFDSNVNATEDDEKSDVILGLTPQVSMKTGWSRHELNGRAYLDAAKYLDQDENDFVDYGLRLGGRYDVSRAGAFRGNVAYDHLHEGKDDDDRITLGDADVVEYNRYTATGGYSHRFNRIMVGGNLIYRLYDWDSFNAGGVTVNQDYRNRQEYGGNLRLTYAVSPRIGLFTQADYLFYNYDNPSPGGREQDSEKYGLSVGTTVDFTAVLFGEASIGYVKQAYKGDTFDDEDGVSADVGLTWNVTTLSTLQLEASRDFLPSSTGGSSRLATDVALSGYHELLRNLILNAHLRYSNQDYKGSDLEKDIYEGGVGADYLITRNFSAGAEYVYRQQDSTADGGDFDKHLVLLRLRAQM